MSGDTDTISEPPSVPDSSVKYIDAVCLEERGSRIRCSWSATKGRVLLAGCSFKPGDVILEEEPLHHVAEAFDSAVFQALESFCKANPTDLPLDPLWYWLAISSLTDEQLSSLAVGKDGSRPSIASVPQELQRRLLMLQGGRGSDVQAASKGIQRLAVKLGFCEASASIALILERLLKAWIVNCFEYSEVPKAYAIYFLPSFMSHSCHPTAVWVLSGPEDDQFVLRARQQIHVGDEITISYLSEDSLLLDARDRRLHLLSSKKFLCNCVRCIPQSPDSSRGFVCPKNGCHGTVSALVTEETEATLGQPLKPSKLSQQMFGSCSLCCQEPTEKEATHLMEEEQWLRTLVQGWEAASPREFMSESEAVELEELICSSFSQHVLADRAYGHLCAVHCRFKDWASACRLTKLRALFQEAAFPGPSGAHAWTLEALADMLLLHHAGIEVERLLQRPQPMAALQPMLNGLIAEKVALEVLPSYCKAVEILGLLFGFEHEYCCEVADKQEALILALQNVGADGFQAVDLKRRRRES
eukprot:TRINITY_DN32071_c0_g2_i1.p1 TRINITY_DN32071_c0_g2~~TRINITY_DN32071_c0_g2_i1.p1  ORF type:complete len:529 (-),score=94.23 TRINITY_DN32071_c0_g2_i1:22-1608(-)